ncbi:MAG: AAA family ATPase [Planctomycetes bacterium]|nr:AAA family ATPase [Planctomycetota bacterium]
MAEMEQTALTGDDYRVLKELGDAHREIRFELSKRIIGQDDVVEQVLTAFFAGGHVLLLGVPGLGKTLLVRSLAEILGLKFNRIQFTPDLMPSDITGSELLAGDSGERSFKFLGGPIFTNFILADEINRTPPKTQAAMLEAMEEGSVTVAGRGYALPRPFFVMATQNPIEQEGTYQLPAAALDRFLFTVVVDYPTQVDELNMLFETTSRFEQRVSRLLDETKVQRMLNVVRKINVSDSTLRYAIDLVRATRPKSSASAEIKDMVECGGSPRATQALIMGAKARAALEGRDEARPADIRAIAMPAMHHRILTNFHAEADGVNSRDLVRKLLKDVPRPAGDEPAAEKKIPFDVMGTIRYWLLGGDAPAHWARQKKAKAARLGQREASLTDFSAGIGARVASAALDVVAYLVIYAVWWIAAWLLIGGGGVLGKGLREVSEPLAIIVFFSAPIVGLGLGVLLEVYLTMKYGASMGKLIIGVRIVREDGTLMTGFGSAMLRMAFKFISVLTGFVGFWWMLWDPENRTLHDKLSACHVVPKDFVGANLGAKAIPGVAAVGAAAISGRRAAVPTT